VCPQRAGILVFKRIVLFVTIVFGGAFLVAVVANSANTEVVDLGGHDPGTIVIKTSERKLYYIIDRNRALRFEVGVGRKGKTWSGRATIEGKYLRPAWEPPDEIRRDNPRLPKLIKGGDADNPMGAAALTMRGGEYAIHGTNDPHSIGGFVSYGCIRMHNRDIVRLYELVEVGTPVVVQ